MIKCGNVWLNPSTIVAIIPMIDKSNESTGGIAIIGPDGTEFQEADACQVRFMGGGGCPVDCRASLVVEAVNEWARVREESDTSDS